MEYLATITSIATLIGIIILTYRHFRDPDVSAKNEIDKLQMACNMRHKTIQIKIKI